MTQESKTTKNSLSEDEEPEVFTPIPSKDSDETQKCFLCSLNLTEMSVEERSKHVNICVEKQSPHSSDDDFQQPVLCDLCQKDITRYK
jgi:CRISPR/Cas system-associated protein Cas10 (large subunit of type III CRISPR-Cas system)